MSRGHSEDTPKKEWMLETNAHNVVLPYSLCFRVCAHVKDCVCGGSEVMKKKHFIQRSWKGIVVLFPRQ